METQELFDILPAGIFTSPDELQIFIDEQGVDDLYPLINKQAFPTLEEFQDSLKKKDILEPDTDLTLDTGLLEQPEIDIPETEIGKLFKATSLNLGSGLARIPTFIKEKVIATAAELSPTIKENLETLNQIPFEQREQVIDALGQGLPGPAFMGYSKYSQELADEAQQILATTKQYDTSITEDILTGEAETVGRGLIRLGEQAVGALPSVLLALLPGGFAALGAGSAATKSRELQEEGKDLEFRTTVNALGTGMAEGVFELATRGLGKEAFKILKEINKTAGKEAAKETLTKIALAFGKGFGIEGSSEVATEGTEDLLDNLLLDEENKFEDNFFKYLDTFLIGGAIGGPIAGLPRLGRKLIQNKQKQKIDKVVEDSKYANLVEAFTPKKDGTTVEIDQLPIVSLPSSDLFLKSTVNGLVKRNEISQAEGEAIKNVYDNAVGIYQQIPSETLSVEEQSQAAALLIEQKNLLDFIAKKKPELVVEEQARIDEIDEQLKNIGKKAAPVKGEAEAAKLEEEKIIEETGEPAPVLEAEEIQPRFRPFKKTIEESVEEITPENIIERRSEIYTQVQNPNITPGVRQKAFDNLINQLAPKSAATKKEVSRLKSKIKKTKFDSPLKIKETLNDITSTLDTKERRRQFKQALDLQAKIKTKLKRDLNPNVKNSGLSFLKIDPFAVQDLNKYLTIAEGLNKGLSKTRIVKGEPKVAPAVNVNEVETYSAEQKKISEALEAQIQNDAFQELTGQSPENISINEIRATLDEAYNNQDVDTDNFIENKFQGKRQIIRESLKDAFTVYSGIVDNQLDTEKPAFTGQEVIISPKQKSIVKRFMNMNLDKLRTKEAVEALDALVNFATNSDTAGMQRVVEYYEGSQMAEVLANEGFKARNLDFLGREWSDKIASIPILMERQFGNQTNALKFLQKSGFNGIRRGAATAVKDINIIIDNYATQFIKTNPNNQAFNTKENNVERGMLAFMRRSPVGTEADIQEDFNRRKVLIENSIIDLRETGDKVDAERAEVYDLVFKKILQDSNTAQEVESKADEINLKAVEFITNEWAKLYPDLKEVNLNMYNNALENDINYTSDAFSLLQAAPPPKLGETSIYETGNRNKRRVYDKEAGVFRENQRLDRLTNRYVNLNFDITQTSRMRQAMTDINTAASIQQLKGFIESEAFKQIIPSDADRLAIDKRVKEYVDQKRGVDYIKESDEVIARRFNRIINLGVSRTLGSLGQYPKQLVPLANTMVNAGGDATVNAVNTFINNPDSRQWLQDIGYDISNRGIQTDVQFENVNNQLEEAPEKLGDKWVDKVDKAQTWWLNKVLVNPDRIAANASWIAYYGNKMKEKGIDIYSPNFDWKTHEVDIDAADFAQQQVDRQQNVSSSSLQGQVFKTKDLYGRLAVKAFLPFSNFLLNQKSRMYSDIMTAKNPANSKEDRARAMRSLAGLAVETVVFNAIGLTLTQMTAAASAAMGAEEKNKKKVNEQFQNRLKGRLTNVISDVLSPLPPLDDVVVGTINEAIKMIDDGKNPYQFYTSNKTLLDDLGLVSIVKEKIGQFPTIIGMLDGEYQGKKFNSEERELAQLTAIMYPFYMAGVLPSEAGNIINYNIKRLKAKR